MTFLKKVNENWQPIEKPGLKVGEIFDFPGPYEALIRQGVAVLVDKGGNEIELPGQVFECPVCFEKVEGLQGFTDHVSKHLKSKTVEKISEEKVEEKADSARAKRLANLEKARAKKVKKNVKGK